jgi:putative ABC transport system permease protein
VIVGRKLADRFGWSIGDPVRIVGDIYPGDWDFVIRGIYTGAKETTDESIWFFRFDLLDERMRQDMPGRDGRVGWFIPQIADPTRAAEISEKIDAMFKNSLAETKSETEEAFTLSFIEMSGTIILGLRIVSFLVIGVILLVLANTMAMTARERLNEYAVLKTLGFRPLHLIGLIFGESIFIAILGGALGLLFTSLTVPVLRNALSNFLPVIPLEGMTYILAVIAALVVGLLAAVFPTFKALRTTIVDGLRTID